MKFKNTLELKKWMDNQTDRALKARGKKIDQLSARMFKADCELFDQALASIPNNGEASG